MARERDLCDVKIKITEYFDGAELTEQTGQQPPVDAALDGNAFFAQSAMSAQGQVSPWAMQAMGPGISMAPAVPKKFYTLQRVNGNGGNGKGDGVPGPHKHTLEDSDKVKKNSVVRWMLKNDKDKKKAQVGTFCSYAFFCYDFATNIVLLSLLCTISLRLGMFLQPFADHHVKAACSCVMTLNTKSSYLFISRHVPFYP